LKILSIDDNEGITETLGDVFEMSGHEYFSTNSGIDAIELIKNNQYDVILLDYSMPEFSGLDVIAKLETMGNLRDFNIVMFTASSISESKINELIQKGVREVIKKPIEVDDLVKRLLEFSSEKSDV